jgi:hypothetical protein
MNNLIPSTKVHGIREPLWFGTGIHHALEKILQSSDPRRSCSCMVRVVRSSMGRRTSYSRSKFLSLSIEIQFLQKSVCIKVSGLSELMPFADQPETIEHFMHLRQLGEGMMKFYRDWAEDNDNFNVVVTEHDFSVPILNLIHRGGSLRY